MGGLAMLPRWRLHVPVFAPFVAAVVALLVLSTVLIYGFVRSAEIADELDRSDKQHLVENYLIQSNTAIAREQKAQITWDDAFVEAAGIPNLDWADQNIGGYFWESFGYENTFLINPDGKVLRAWAKGMPANPAKFEPLASRVEAMLERMSENRQILGVPKKLKQLKDTHWPFDEAGRPLSRWSGQQVWFEGKPALLTVMPVLPDVTYDLVKQTPNHVVTVNLIDAAFLAQMEKALLLKNVRFVRSIEPHDKLHSIPIIPLARGHAGHLSWTAGQPGKRIFATNLPMLAIVLLYSITVLMAGAFAFRRMRTVANDLATSVAQAKFVAMHDSMSNLPNRAHFQRKLTEQLAKVAESVDDNIVLVAFIDLDRFKDVNDTLGHKAGDDLIRIVAQRLKKGLPEGDVLARLGGDEFVVLRVVPRSKTAVRRLGLQITRILSKPAYILDQELIISASCGISMGPDHGMDPGDLLRHADIALYQAKQRGRGRWCGFTLDMDEHVQKRRDIELELRKAIGENRFDVAYQPIISARGQKIVSVEALLRWNMPGKGLISPGLFVPIAEQTGQMVRLGLWILRRVFEDSRAWPGLAVSVNLSPVQIVAKSFLANLRTIVTETGIDPRRITFEITEGVLLDRTDEVLAVLAELRAMGFKIALDDFGTGYSSLAYLRSFRFDKIKIDQSFVQNIENDLDALRILKAVVSLGESLRMIVVAEGVETLLQRELVVAAGCQEIQGYFYSRPVSSAHISRLLVRSGKAQFPVLAQAA